MKKVMKNVIEKNFPNNFPIRYALVVKFHKGSYDFDFSADAIKRQEALFRQLLSLLQQKPLSKSMLVIEQTLVKFEILGVEIINIAQIGKSRQWVRLAEKKIKEILPDAKMKFWKTGPTFSLGLYSYEGNLERPAFFRAYKYNEKAKKDEKDEKDNIPNKYKFRNKFCDDISSEKIDFFYNTYEKIRKGEINELEIYQLLNQYEKPIQITSCQSDLWKMLDERDSNSIIYPSYLPMYLAQEIKNLKEKNNYEEKISITVCKNWGSLFAEEILTLYKMFRFCNNNNCGKALPFSYSGSYCPDIKENEKCVKERAKIRSRKRKKHHKKII